VSFGRRNDLGYNSRSMPTAEEEIKQEGSTLKEPEKDLVLWTAPSRPFRKADREYYVTIIATAAIVGLVLFLVEGWMPVVLLVSLVFLFYVMTTVEPENIEYKVTTAGIKVAGKLTGWDRLVRFWFSRRFDHDLLVFETLNIPGRIEFVITPESKEEVKKAILKYLPEEEASPSYLDKAANWLSKRIPGNR
jgi:hypothetical protein